MTDLKHQLVPVRQFDQFIRFRNGDCNRFFDQDMYAAGKEIPGNGVVELCGHNHADGIDLSDQLAMIADGGRAQRGGYFSGAFRIAVHHPYQFDILHGGVFLGMEVPQVTNADDGCP